MGRGGCNCCGDWCTTAAVSPNGGLEWNYNYGQDAFNVGTISGNVYTCGQNNLYQNAYNGNSVVRKVPYGSSHSYDLIQPDPFNNNFTNSVYLKKLETSGKFINARQVTLGSFLGYANWYDWNAYTQNYLQMFSSENYMYIMGDNKVGFIENSDVAKYVITGQYIGNEYKYVSNYQLGWDLIPKFMYNSFNTLWGWAGYFGYSPLAASFGNNKKTTLALNDTVLFGSYSTYYNYYNANGLTNVVSSFVSVDDDRIHFKVIGAANIEPITDIGSKVLGPNEEAVDIEYTSWGDYVVNWWPLGSNQLVHTYDEFLEDGNPVYIYAKPLVSISASQGITVYDADLLPNYETSVWADLSVDGYNFVDGAFEIFFSLPLINQASGQYFTCNPESWPALLDNMVFGMNQTFTVDYDIVSVDGDGNETVNSYEEVNEFFMTFGTNGYYGYNGQYWGAIGYYYSPINITSSNFTGNIPGFLDAYIFYRYNTCITELSPDEIRYHNLDVLDFVAANFGTVITTPNDVPVIPIDTTIDVDVDDSGIPDLTELNELEADPLDYLGIPRYSQGTDIQFFDNIYDYWGSPYQFNKIGVDGNIYAVMTVEYVATQLIYTPSYQIIYPEGFTTWADNAGNTVTLEIVGDAVASNQFPVYGAKSYMMDFDESFNIIGGFGLDEELSSILLYDNTNQWAINNGYAPFFTSNPSLRDYLYNANLYTWYSYYYNWGYNFTTSVDYIERTGGQLRFGINELFQKQQQYGLQFECLNEGSIIGATVPLWTNNYALNHNPSIIVRDDTGELCELLGQVLSGSQYRYPVIFNPDVGATSAGVMAGLGPNMIALKADGSRQNEAYIPHSKLATADPNGNVVVGAINSSNRILMSTGFTYLLGNGGIDMTPVTYNVFDPVKYDAIWSFAENDYMYPAECIFLKAEFSRETVDEVDSDFYMIQITGVNVEIPLEATAKEINVLLSAAGLGDLEVTGGPILDSPICIAGFDSREFNNLIDGIAVNDSLGKLRINTGYFPVWADVQSDYFYFQTQRPEFFTADVTDALWNFGQWGSAEPYIGWWGFYGWFDGYAGFANQRIYTYFLLDYIENVLGLPVIFRDVNDILTWSIPITGINYQDIYNGFSASITKNCAPLTEQLGFIAPYMTFTSPSKDRISWDRPLSIDELAGRLDIPEMLDLDWISGVGESNPSSLFHSGMMAKAVNSQSTIYSEPAALYQIKKDGTIGWTAPFGYKARDQVVSGVTFEQNAAFCGVINDMTINDAGRIFVATNMINLGESKPTAYSSYSEYYNSEVLNRIDIRKATKDIGIMNNVSGVATDANGNPEFDVNGNEYEIPLWEQNTLIYDSLGQIDNTPVSPKGRYRVIYEPVKILRTE